MSQRDDLRRRLAPVANRMSAWMHQSSWPLWWRRARLANGAFREVLDFEGNPDTSTESRVRVQARQVFSFALARRLGWREDALEHDLSESLRRFRLTCFREDGIAGRRVDIERGELIDNTPDLYDNAFCVLALAACRQVLDPALTESAWRQLLASLDEHMAVDAGQGFHEFLPPPDTRRQNPHMHLFESLLLLYEATGDDSVRERAERLFAFIEERFFDQSQNVVSEHVDAQRTAVATYEPGHSMEWVWLLGYRARLFNTDLHPFAVSLYEHFLAAGMPEGRTPMALTTANAPQDMTRRLWSQTESLKAHLCMLELGPGEGRAAAAARAHAAADAIASDWLTNTVDGGWRDRFDEHGRAVADNMPASTGYHLYLAISELARLANN